MSIIHCLFNDQEIRFIDGNPVANDVAAILGYKDPANAVNRLVKPKNKGVADLQTPGGIQPVAVLKEAGIYQLIFSSKLAGAEEFQDWVFEDVLPSIRKTGSYSIFKESFSIYDLDEETLRKLVLLANLKFAPELIGSEPELSAEVIVQDIASLDARLHDMDIDVAFHLFSLFAIENEIWNRPLPENIEDRVDFDTVPQKIQRFRSNAENPTYIEAAAEFQAKIDRTQLAGINNQKRLA